MSIRNVLLIDDDKLIGKMVSSFFLSRGIRVEIARSGKEGLEILENMKPDAIVLDLMMPEMNGFEFCEIVKSNDLMKDTPVVILSAFASDENIKRSKVLGAADFIKKPFNIRELTEKVLGVMK